MHFLKESLIHASPDRVFAFHEQDSALKLLSPPWETARVIQHAKISDIGSRAIIETNIIGPIKTRWIAEHTVYQPPHLFEDVQIKGPFRSWRHRHIITAHPEGATLRDEIEYEPPLGIVGRIFAPLLIEKRLRKLFDYRHGVTREWCEEKKLVQCPKSIIMLTEFEESRTFESCLCFRLMRLSDLGTLNLGCWRTLTLDDGLWTSNVSPWIQNAC